jgi:hypothetical protein
MYHYYFIIMEMLRGYAWDATKLQAHARAIVFATDNGLNGDDQKALNL